MQSENSENLQASLNSLQNDTFVSITWTLSCEGLSSLVARRWDGRELVLLAETPEQRQHLEAIAKDVEKRILDLKKQMFG